jgi:hypothetical protein
MGVEVVIPADFGDQVLKELQPLIDAALSTAEVVARIIKDQAILENEDVDGNQMAQKKGRPPKNPKNFVGLPLIQNDDPDMMANERWSHERTGPLEETITYDPPDHLQYLIEKPPEVGGRKWILPDRINESAREKIMAEMARRIEEAL